MAGRLHLSGITDPYMVLTDSGRLVWIVDGYMTSDAHPYSRDHVDEDWGTSTTFATR